MRFAFDAFPSYTEDMITSLTNPKIKNLAKLNRKKYRDETGTFLAEGIHMLEEALKADLVLEVFAAPDTELEEWGDVDFPVTHCTQEVLNKLSGNTSKSSIITLCKRPQWSASQKESWHKILLLDRLQDPGNVGTLIRAAYSFGVDAIYLSTGCADPLSFKTLQSSKGAFFHIPVLYTFLDEEIKDLQSRNIPVFAAALHTDAINLKDLAIPQSFGLMIGNEGQGISKELLTMADQAVYIEMQHFESLNAAMAGSILLYAFQFPSES